jgi:hypothetical protein
MSSQPRATQTSQQRSSLIGAGTIRRHRRVFAPLRSEHSALQYNNGCSSSGTSCVPTPVVHISSSPIFAASNHLTALSMPCSISQGFWVVCLPFCEGMSRPSPQRHATRVAGRVPPMPCPLRGQAQRLARAPPTVALPAGVWNHAAQEPGSLEHYLTLRSPRAAGERLSLLLRTTAAPPPTRRSLTGRIG